MDSVAAKTGWLVLAILGAFCLGTIALHRGDTINAIWLVAAATSIFLVAHRFYARFISEKALGIDPTRATPAVRCLVSAAQDFLILFLSPRRDGRSFRETVRAQLGPAAGALTCTAS